VLVRALALVVKVGGACDAWFEFDGPHLRGHGIGIDGDTLVCRNDLLRRSCESGFKVNDSLRKEGQTPTPLCHCEMLGNVQQETEQPQRLQAQRRGAERTAWLVSVLFFRPCVLVGAES
jgi:hypothetical protein